MKVHFSGGLKLDLFFIPSLAISAFDFRSNSFTSQSVNFAFNSVERFLLLRIELGVDFFAFLIL